MNWLKKTFKMNDQVDYQIFKQAIFDYRSEGKKLMFELGKKYGLDIQNPEEYTNLVSKSNDNIPRNGKLSKGWNYSFHGGECGFHNSQKKMVEVVLSNAPEFGHIDSWFLLSYMKSTEKYQKHVKQMQWDELQKVIGTLYDSGEVQNIE